ncbi:hypothetical protein MPL3356_350070 [Mesorhizobium plurifarium]|uniref:Uncharacterized protein n=1 Tax=Mesorhizobium plurifarium TaxID=69974 RepID=A0A090E3G9_MESPL|nr:hypothetical protein MPL3356_350070 [Mesorhizobium plurifarium]
MDALVALVGREARRKALQLRTRWGVLRFHMKQNPHLSGDSVHVLGSSEFDSSICRRCKSHRIG